MRPLTVLVDGKHSVPLGIGQLQIHLTTLFHLVSVNCKYIYELAARSTGSKNYRVLFGKDRIGIDLHLLLRKRATLLSHLDLGDLLVMLGV